MNSSMFCTPLALISNMWWHTLQFSFQWFSMFQLQIIFFSFQLRLVPYEVVSESSRPGFKSTDLPYLNLVAIPSEIVHFGRTYTAIPVLFFHVSKTPRRSFFWRFSLRLNSLLCRSGASSASNSFLWTGRSHKRLDQLKFNQPWWYYKRKLGHCWSSHEAQGTRQEADASDTVPWTEENLAVTWYMFRFPVRISFQIPLVIPTMRDKWWIAWSRS